MLRLGALAAIVASSAVATPPGSPVATAAVAQEVSRIDAGWSHTCAVSDAGRVKCWGRNRNYQLGDGTQRNRFTPVRVSNLERDVVSIAAGSFHTCALLDTGSVKCWGYGVFGQLGDGSSSYRSSPVDVVDLHRGAVAIAAGYSQTCALMNTGGVKCWGATGFGRFSTPVDVPHLTSGVAAISAGSFHTCALTDAGAVVCWGSNYYGELGDGTTTRRTTPVDVVGLTTGVAAISAGRDYTCAVTDAAGAKCWGLNSSNQLGDGSTAERRLSPVDVSGLTSGVIAVSAGVEHTCALTEVQGAKCWGKNTWGQLGHGTTSNRKTPVNVSGTRTGIAAISLGYEHTCALTDAGGAKCWGNNGSGQLGDGSTREQLIPDDVVDLRGGVAAISAGNEFTCALTTGGGAKCWGWNDGSSHYRLLGNRTRSNRSVPVDVSGLTSGVVAISSSYFMTCAVTDAGRVMCWGSNYWGQLGDGTTQGRNTPVRVSGLTDAVDIAAGGDHTCALTDLGGVKCWGANDSGQVGDGTTRKRLTPVDVSGLTSGIAAISAGYGYTCALMEAGSVKCWGSNYVGQLGDGSTQDRLTPIDVPGLSDGIATISTGDFNACATTEAGAALCWGTGPLGDGATHHGATPIRIPGLSSGVVATSAGNGYTCAIVAAGQAKCWGTNLNGELGDGTTKYRLTPVAVSGLTSGVAAISSGSEHACAITDAGRAKCWGANIVGQVGNGTPTWEPVDVVGSFP